MSQAPANPRKKVTPQPTRLSEPFWQAATQGRWLLQKHRASGTHQFFPKPLDPLGGSDLEWVQAVGTGRLLAYTECHVAGPGFVGELPYVMGIVALDESVRVLAQVLAPAAQLQVGQRMRACWPVLDAIAPMYAFEPIGSDPT